MMSILGALHTIAAQRGEGLLPEFVGLLNRPTAASEADRAPRGCEAAEKETRRRLNGAADAIPGQEPEFCGSRTGLTLGQVTDPDR